LGTTAEDFAAGDSAGGLGGSRVTVEDGRGSLGAAGEGGAVCLGASDGRSAGGDLRWAGGGAGCCRAAGTSGGLGVAGGWGRLAVSRGGGKAVGPGPNFCGLAGGGATP